MININWTLQI